MHAIASVFAGMGVILVASLVVYMLATGNGVSKQWKPVKGDGTAGFRVAYVVQLAMAIVVLVVFVRTLIFFLQ